MAQNMIVEFFIMDKVNVYILDTRKCTLNELLSFANLSVEDEKSLDKFKIIDVKKEHVASIYFKNKYIGETYLNEYGKPLSKNVFFNISHSKGVVVLGVCKTRDIGVDVEVIRSKDEELVKYICNEEEYEFIKNEIDFFTVWTNKESLVKCLGTGIRNKIKTIPSLPVNGPKAFSNEEFYSKVIKNGNHVISLTLKGDKDFEYELNVESVS